MDQQASLVSNGYALTYESPESADIPDWAKWKDQAFATTYEPIILVYNRNLLPAAEVPQTRADLVRLLNADPDRFRGKVETYDIERSGVGFFLATQDVAASPAFWDLAKALHRAKARRSSADDRRDGQARGVGSSRARLQRAWFLCARSGTEERVARHGFPEGLHAGRSRIMLINRKAAHPNAARLWVDYILSKRGQTVIANNARSVRGARGRGRGNHGVEPREEAGGQHSTDRSRTGPDRLHEQSELRRFHPAMARGGDAVAWIPRSGATGRRSCRPAQSTRARRCRASRCRAATSSDAGY